MCVPNLVPIGPQTATCIRLERIKLHVTECTNYMGIHLMCQGMKLYGRLVEDRLRQFIEISSTQYGVKQGKYTTEPIFAIRMMQEKHLEKRQNLHDLCRSRKGV